MSVQHNQNMRLKSFSARLFFVGSWGKGMVLYWSHYQPNKAHSWWPILNQKRCWESRKRTIHCFWRWSSTPLVFLFVVDMQKTWYCESFLNLEPQMTESWCCPFLSVVERQFAIANPCSPKVSVENVSSGGTRTPATPKKWAFHFWPWHGRTSKILRKWLPSQNADWGASLKRGGKGGGRGDTWDVKAGRPWQLPDLVFNEQLFTLDLEWVWLTQLMIIMAFVARSGYARVCMGRWFGTSFYLQRRWCSPTKQARFVSVDQWSKGWPHRS